MNRLMRLARLGVALMWVLAMIGAWSMISTLDASAAGGLNRQAQPVTVLDDDEADEEDETGENDGEEDADEESAV